MQVLALRRSCSWPDAQWIADRRVLQLDPDGRRRPGGGPFSARAHNPDSGAFYGLPQKVILSSTAQLPRPPPPSVPRSLMGISHSRGIQQAEDAQGKHAKGMPSNLPMWLLAFLM